MNKLLLDHSARSETKHANESLAQGNLRVVQEKQAQKEILSVSARAAALLGTFSKSRGLETEADRIAGKALLFCDGL